jgi:hypothetical protein
MQRGQVFKSGDSWKLRLYEDGVRRQRGGFASKREATVALEEALRLARTGQPIRAPLTLAELASAYLNVHDASPARMRKLAWALAKAVDAFGDTRIDQLRAQHLAQWRMTLPERQRHEVFAVVRQVLDAAVTWGDLDKNPAKGIKNPTPTQCRDPAVRVLAEVERVADELGSVDPRLRGRHGPPPGGVDPAPLVDVDLERRVVTVRRTAVDGEVRSLLVRRTPASDASHSERASSKPSWHLSRGDGSPSAR